MPSFNYMPLAFILSELRPMFTACFSAGGYVGEQRPWDRQPQQEAGDKESSCSTSGGQRGVKLGLLHVVISSEKSGL